LYFPFHCHKTNKKKIISLIVQQTKTRPKKRTEITLYLIFVQEWI
jgi:hypothetical protein